MRPLAAAALLSALALPAAAHPGVGVVVDRSGAIFYTDLKQVWRIAPDGTKSVAVAGVHTHELFLDADGALFGEHLWYEGDATKKWGHYVWRRDAAGRVSMVIPRTEGFLSNYSFVRDAAGNMYWADRDHNAIVMRTPAGRNQVIARAPFRDIRWMHALPDGTVYFIDQGDLVRIGRDRKLTRMVIQRNADRHDLQGLWHDRAGNIYIAHSDKRRVLRVTPAGKITVVTKSPLFWSPSGGTFNAKGELVLLEYSPLNDVRVRVVK